MNLEQIAVLISLIGLIAVLIHGRIQTGMAFSVLALGYYATGMISLNDLLTSYADPSLAVLVLLMLVSVALEKTILLEQIGAKLLSGSYFAALFRLMSVTSIFSGFLNNTAVVASLLGIISQNKRFAPSRLLIPLSYAALFGGVLTLIGTSTNLMINGFAERAGMAPLGLFSFALVGVPVMIVGIITVMLLSRWLLPEHQGEATKAGSYFLEAQVEAGSSLIGKSVLDNQLRSLDGLFLVEILRGTHLISPVEPGEIIEASDILIFAGEVDRIYLLNRFDGLSLFEAPVNILQSNLVEVVVVADSMLVDRTIRDVNFRALFDAAVVGIRRGERRLSGKIGTIPLKAGDSLTLAVGPDFASRRNLDRNFYLLKGGSRKARLNLTQSYSVFAGFIGVIILAAVNALPLFMGLGVFIVGLLAVKFISVSELRRRFPFELLLVIGSALVLSHVMTSSGLAELAANALHLVLQGQPALYALIAIYLTTLVLTELMSNNAAAAMVFPIAFSLAQSMGVSPLPFVMALVFGASASFITPFGYQTHLMVYTPGRYRFMDFVRIGVPVSVAYSATVLTVLPFAFPFHPQ
ncbi:SLC13 family permease [Halothiobacillus neapolitanus]|uniref:TrkA-C domain protein n=1 Tax=Halothiobacillus neapolitanus (strain ATCC 23641 / DSM 15147 / CIP 104769 / NCIMB 8539 / c2) TaxID=555778 RepID=D0L0V7_HALNC|nr:SLC13 family permease [Halothiobacillus neapolitanus]ACX96330.1 TrkA-C domain protein [Halothiobacillus neapolitanus c2]TDN66643.1 di/tricarboxylate transporter [Halothiobacillus neapolitanus]